MSTAVAAPRKSSASSITSNDSVAQPNKPPSSLQEQEQAAAAASAAHDETHGGVCEKIKLVVGTLVVFTLIVVVFAGVSLQYCILQLHPAINFFLMFGALTMLAYVEALHYAVVAIEKWDMTPYKQRFPRACKVHLLIDEPQKVKKFLVGRQFFVIFVVFLLAQITSFPGIPRNWLGMPSVLVLILLETGLPGIAITLTVGQLISQLYVEEFTLQFMNYYGVEFVIRLSLFVEWIGVCNFSWLLYALSSRAFCRKVRRRQKIMDRDETASNRSSASASPTVEDASPVTGPRTELTTTNGAAELEDGDGDDEMTSPTARNRPADFDLGTPKSTSFTWFDYFKYVWSTCATLGAVVIVCNGIAQDTYVLPVPPVAAFLLAISLLTILFYLEGLMIAIVTVQYWDPETWRLIYPRAHKVHMMLAKPDHVKRFIIGRQFFTVLTNFLLAQIFTFHHWNSGSYNEVGFFIIVQSGLVGVLIILSFAQLMPELLAAEYPLRFMNLPGSYSVCAISLFFDSCAVGHAGWTIYYTLKFLVFGQGEEAKHEAEQKPEIVRVNSAEILVGQDRYVKRQSASNGSNELNNHNDPSPPPQAQLSSEVV